MATERDYKGEHQAKQMDRCVNRGLLCSGSRCMGWRSVDLVSVEELEDPNTPT